MSIWNFSAGLPDVPTSCRLTLGESNTPLLRSRSIGPQCGFDELFFKVESANPTGSYKDRFAAVAVSDMLARNQRLCLATSSGNTGSALAAYCAASGVACRILIVESAPQAKLKQMLAYGARLATVRGFGVDSKTTADAMEQLKTLAGQQDACLQISAFYYSPVGMAGVQTISYELATQLDRINHVFCPAGGGGLTLAVVRGFAQLEATARPDFKPAVHCVQPVGNDTMAGALRAAGASAQAVACTTRISGLQVPNVIDGDEVIAGCRRIGGSGHLVEDEEVWAAQRRLAREEGIFCEPAGAVALAGAMKAMAAGELDRDAVVVCLVTGSAFKDQPSVDQMADDRLHTTIELKELTDWLMA